LKLAERARVRASGSTAASSRAWELRLRGAFRGYKKFFENYIHRRRSWRRWTQLSFSLCWL